MADVQPLRALRYEPAVAGPLADVVAPPYDVIDPEQRARLAARSPYNVVHVDLPEGGADPYAAAAATLHGWQREGAVVREPDPALWALRQDYEAPGEAGHRTRSGFLCRVRIEDYGPGRIRPHERTHPGPREDRLRLTRATRTNLSPIFALHSDPAGAARSSLAPHAAGEPWGDVTDDEGTRHRTWRVTDPDAIEAAQAALADAELLIADGHHRYETARVYADAVGGEGPHRYVLMCLVALEDPGLTVFPTHRLVRGLSADQQEALAATLRRDFDIAELSSTARLAPPAGEDIKIGYTDSHFRRPLMLTLKDPAIAATALPGRAEPYRRLDTAVLEALILKGALGLTDQEIDELKGLGYARDFDQAVQLVHNATFDAAFVMAPTP